MKKPIFAKMGLAEFVYRQNRGMSTKLRVVGYVEEGGKRVRTAPAGLMPTSWPSLAYGKDNGKNPSQKPPKHARGFSEKYLAKPIIAR